MTEESKREERPANEYDVLCKIEFQLKRLVNILERAEHYGLQVMKK